MHKFLNAIVGAPKRVRPESSMIASADVWFDSVTYCFPTPFVPTRSLWKGRSNPSS